MCCFDNHGLIPSPPPALQCIVHWKRVLRPGITKGTFTKEEDQILIGFVKSLDVKKDIDWSVVASQLQGRTHKQVRDRWVNSLDPTLIKGPWSEIDTKRLIDLHAASGTRWSHFAAVEFPGRSENSVKNRWYSKARIKLSESYTPPAANIPVNVAATFTTADQTRLR